MTDARCPDTASPAEGGRADDEAAVVRQVRDRRRARPPTPRMRLHQDERTGAVTVDFDHERPAAAHALLMDAMGTGDARFADELLTQVAALGEQGARSSKGASNFALAVIEAVAPRDALEAMLATQMAAVHQATMMLARRLNHVETIAQQDAAERALNKLARTYAGQMETLKRYRSKGPQTVRVERVTVQDGGQAIVGSVETGGRGHDET